jgi:hypothetical protein
MTSFRCAPYKGLASPAPHCATLTLVNQTIMADSWRDGILLKVISPLFSVIPADYYPDLERTRLFPLPWPEHIHHPGGRVHPRQRDVYHTCPMGISHLVCTPAFVQRLLIYPDPGL